MERERVRWREREREGEGEMERDLVKNQHFQSLLLLYDLVG
jgi:hypothetical protein